MGLTADVSLRIIRPLSGSELMPNQGYPECYSISVTVSVFVCRGCTLAEYTPFPGLITHPRPSCLTALFVLARYSSADDTCKNSFLQRVLKGKGRQKIAITVFLLQRLFLHFFLITSFHSWAHLDLINYICREHDCREGRVGLKRYVISACKATPSCR